MATQKCKTDGCDSFVEYTKKTVFGTTGKRNLHEQAMRESKKTVKRLLLYCKKHRHPHTYEFEVDE